MPRAAVLLLALWLAGCAGKGRPPSPEDTAKAPVRLVLLAINDFHGALLPGQVAGKPAGGAAVLATWLRLRAEAAREAGDHAVLVHAGDVIGASPLESALLQDEPTVQALDAMGIGFGAVGNHEFDEGPDELLRLQKGGCHPRTEPVTGCFRGARFQWLAANVVRAGSGEPILPPYAVVETGGVRVAFIGAVLRGTPQIVAAKAVEGLRFLDEADSVNRYVAELAGRGIRAIVVLLHQGGFAASGGSKIQGEVVEVLERLDSEVDVVMSGHTHRGYVGKVQRRGGGPPLLVAQAHADGTAFAEFDVRLDRLRGDVVAADARVVRTFHHADPSDPASVVPPDPEVAAIVARAEAAAAPLARRVVGRAAAPITRERNAAGESALGNLVADAHRASTDADLAFTNPGGLRHDLPAGDLTYAALFAAQPFGNALVTMSLTGEEVRRLLEQQWQPGADGRETVRVLAVSGLRYARDDRRPHGSRVADLRLADGRPLEPSRTYRVTVNDFLAGGGDGFTPFRDGRDRRGGPLDLDALAAFVERLPQPIGAAAEGRVTRR